MVKILKNPLVLYHLKCIAIAMIENSDGFNYIKCVMVLNLKRDKEEKNPMRIANPKKN